MRRLAVDPGTARTGLAVAEQDMFVATPLRTLHHRGPQAALNAIVEVAREISAQEIILGLPLRMDGSEGEAARRARRLAEALQARVEIPVVLWDERLTTVSAHRALGDQGVRGRSRREVVDQAAATLLLQSYLDAQARPDSQEDNAWEPMTNQPPPKPQPRTKPRRPRSGRKGDRGAG